MRFLDRSDVSCYLLAQPGYAGVDSLTVMFVDDKVRLLGTRLITFPLGSADPNEIVRQGLSLDASGLLIVLNLTGLGDRPLRKYGSLFYNAVTETGIELLDVLEIERGVLKASTFHQPPREPLADLWQ